MTKKIFAISTLLLVVVVAFAFIYNFVFRKPSASSTGNSAATKTAATDEGKVATGNTSAPSQGNAAASPASPSNSTGGNSSAGSSAITAVSDESVFGAALSADGKFLLYFLAGNGQLNQVSFDGKLDKVLSTEKYDSLKKIAWNRQKTKVIIKTKSAAGKTKYLVYDLGTKKVSVLKDNTDSAAWSNMGDKIIYKYFDPKTKKRTISASDPDGKNWRDLADFDFQNVEISAIPNSSEIAFWPSPDAFLSTTVGQASFSGEDKREILHDRFGADFLWSPDGSRAVVSYTAQKGGHTTDLATINRDGNEFQSLGFASFASKCVWSADSKYLFCALPGDISANAVLPNDWQEGKTRTADTFWKIEVASGKKDRLIEVEKIPGSFDVLNPFLAKDEKTLFFVNKVDGKLYKLSI